MGSLETYINGLINMALDKVEMDVKAKLVMENKTSLTLDELEEIISKSRVLGL